MTLNVRPAIVIVPVRAVVLVFASTVKLTVPFPVPNCPASMTIQLTWLVAVHAHVDAWGGASLRMEDIRFPETKQYAQDVFEKRRDYVSHYRSELGL